MINEALIDEDEQRAYEDFDSSYHMPHHTFDRLADAVKNGEYGGDFMIVDIISESGQFCISRLLPGVFNLDEDRIRKEIHLIWNFVADDTMGSVTHEDISNAKTFEIQTPHKKGDATIIKLKFKLDLETVTTIDDVRSFIADLAAQIQIKHGAAPGEFAQAHYDAHRQNCLDLNAIQ